MHSKTGHNQRLARGFGELRVYSRRTDREIGREVLDRPEKLKDALDRLFSQRASETDLIFYFVPNSAALNEIETADWARKFVESDLEKYIAEELGWRLSPEDYQRFRKGAVDIPDATARRRIHEALDEVIMQAALHQGPRIFLLPVILQRVSDWALDAADNGRRWIRLGKQFALIGPVMRGARAPLDQWWVRSRQEILKEVKVLQRTLQQRSRERMKSPIDRVLLDEVGDVIAAAPEIFPKLTRIGDTLQLFLGAQPDTLRSLQTKQIRPALFTDELIGWITNRDPESARQKISGLGSKRKPVYR